MRTFLNDNSFIYTARRGTIFRCDRCDLASDIRVIGAPDEPSVFAVEVAEMIAHHATEIHPKLNGFSGYDTLRFIIR